jgi:hypothetical protein
MAFKRLVVVSPLFSVNAPQPARFRELVRRWAGRFDVTVLAFDTGAGAPDNAEGSGLALMKFSRAGRLLIGSRIKFRDQEQNDLKQNGSGISRRKPGLRNWLRKVHINRFFFPDVFIVEYQNIRKQLLTLVGRLQPDAVIISVSPFSLLFLAGTLKRKFPQIKVVIDTGDPFHGDSSSYSRRLLHRLVARRIERAGLEKADMTVVPSLILKKHYLSCYGDVLDEQKVQIIENGISEAFTRIRAGRADRSAPFRMVYAGRFYGKMRDPSGLYAAVQQFQPGEVLLKVFGNIQEEYLPPASDIRFMTGGAVSTDRLAREYEESDLVVYLDNAYGVQIPGKVYEVLAVNRPVLYICRDTQSPSYEIVSGREGVITVCNDSREIADGITLAMKQVPAEKYLRGSEMFTFDSLASRYSILLEKLISGD